MNKEKFIEFLKDPSLLRQNDLSELDDLVIEHPYFQAARILEAKGNRLLKTPTAGKKTASAAIYSTNRVLLKKYLAGEGATVRKPSPDKHVPAQKPSAPGTPITPTEQFPEPKESTSTPEVSTPSDSSSLDHLIESIYSDLEEMKRSRAKYIETARKIEEEEAVEKAVKKATENAEVDTTPNVWKSYNDPDGEEKPVKSKTTAKSSTTKKSPAKKTTAAKTTTAKKSTSAKKPATKSATKKTTSKSKTTGTSKAATKDKKATTRKTTSSKASASKSSTKTPAKKSTGRSTRTSKSAKSTKKDDKDGDNQRELIEQFIKNNPSFKPSKDGKSIDDLSTESTTLSDDIASEYLAEIFLDQGKKEQALKIYNSLMLRFPEKKAYFAGRIKKIK